MPIARKRILLEYSKKDLRRLQLVELDILKAIDGVCQNYGISYFLDSGTLLGAKRHGGFIPWDDDIDIGMPRDDFERFLNVAPEVLGDDYVVVDPFKDNRQAGLFAKVWKKGTKFFTEETIEAGIDQGIFIDIFPYDLVASEKKKRNKQLRSCLAWQSLSYLYHSKVIVVPHSGLMGSAEKIACRIAHSFVRLALNPTRIYRSFRKYALSAKNDKLATECACMNYVQGSIFPKEVLFPTAQIEFEASTFPAPANPEEYLRILYGETWGELPPLEKRRNHAPVELAFGD